MRLYPATEQEATNALRERLNETRAKREALEAVTINTGHKTLTNRAISGGRARIGDYLSIGKALYVPYSYERADGSTKHMSETYTAYSYTDENGAELGSDGFTRISRTITPAELAEVVAGAIENAKSYEAQLEGELARVGEIVARYNAAVAEVNAVTDDISAVLSGALQRGR